MANKKYSIYQRKDGRWEGRIYSKGEHKYRSVYAPTYEQAKDKLELIEAGEANQKNDKDLTLAGVIELWLASRSQIKPTSLASYRNKIENHILPYLKNIPYTELTAADLEQFKINKLSEGFSSSYVSTMVVIIKSASKYVSQMYDCQDPFITVKSPKIHKKPAKLLSADQQTKFAQACLRSGLPGLGCFMSLFLGLRIGEICGLKWENIDFTTSTLSVRNNVQRVTYEDGTSSVIVLPPKTYTSVRDIPLPQFVVDVLRKYQRSGNIFVITGKKKPTEPRAFTYHFKAILKKAGLPSVKYHSLRHAFASNFLRQTGDVKSLSEILGHSNAEITLKVYVHTSMEQKMSGMEKMAALL